MHSSEWALTGRLISLWPTLLKTFLHPSDQRNRYIHSVKQRDLYLTLKSMK